MTTLAVSLDSAMQIDGALGVALVDYESGMLLAKEGGGPVNLDVAAAGNSDVIRAKMRTMQLLNLRTGIEDVLITLGDQYHIIRLLNSGRNLFLYLVLNRAQANLAMARYKLTEIEKTIRV